MAARLNQNQTDAVRAKIRGSQLVNRLQAHVDGEVELSNTQVTAALGLLRKVIPDLSVSELRGEVTVGAITIVKHEPASQVLEHQERQPLQLVDSPVPRALQSNEKK